MKKLSPVILLTVAFVLFSASSANADGVIPTVGRACPPDTVCTQEPQCDPEVSVCEAGATSEAQVSSNEGDVLTIIIEAVSNTLDIIF